LRELKTFTKRLLNGAASVREVVGLERPRLRISGTTNHRMGTGNRVKKRIRKGGLALGLPYLLSESNTT